MLDTESIKLGRIKDLNITWLIGRVKEKPKHIVTNTLKINGEPSDCCKFNLATNERIYKWNKKTQKKEQKTITQWHTIKCFNKNAKYALENLDKNSLVLIIGKINYYKPASITEEESHQKTEIIATILNDYTNNGISKRKLESVLTELLDEGKLTEKITDLIKDKIYSK